MKKIVFIFTLLTKFSVFLFSQSNQWSFVKGDSSFASYSIYGNRGVPSAENKPGERSESASWKDGFGNFWLFGGNGIHLTGDKGVKSDLWRFDVQTKQWTWVNGDSSLNNNGEYGIKGTPSAGNKPGPRIGSATWADGIGNLWLFGGTGYDINGKNYVLNDLWKYNIITNQWTWISGDNIIDQPGVYGIKGASASGNKPGARSGSAAWIDDSGNLWLFGGYHGLGYSDLWKFNVSLNEWTWVKGDSTVNNDGVYGEEGVPAETNNPGGRGVSFTWKDGSGNLWLFGGFGIFANGNPDYLNDLWKYNINSNQWTSIKGYQLPKYGTLGKPNSENTPGGRSGGVAWIDLRGNFWLMGGYGYATDGQGILNDVWKFDVTANQWTWVKGENIVPFPEDERGYYGSKGMPLESNKPRSRSGSCGWTDNNGNFWLFGGLSFKGFSVLSDLWELDLNTLTWTWVSGDNLPSEGRSNTGQYGSINTSSIYNKPGAREGSTTWSDASGNIMMFGGFGYGRNEIEGSANDVWKFNTVTSEWTWIKGDDTISSSTPKDVYGTIGISSSSSNPGGRSHCLSWKDGSGNLWLFGGERYISFGVTEYFNDLWKYNYSNNQWTWIKGDSTSNKNGIYGTKGSASMDNNPGARSKGVSWLDASGNLWLFGGAGYASTGNASILNDLWRYNVGTNQWTWVSGDNTANVNGSYNTVEGGTSVNNKPGSRRESVSWNDASGNLWLYGGFGNDIEKGVQLNDLWRYNVSIDQWTWVRGFYGSKNPIYGTQSVPSTNIDPGARYGSVAWTDIQGNFWLFAGTFANNVEPYNDLWKYTFSTNQWTWVRGDNITAQNGIYGQQELYSSFNKPGSRKGSSSCVDNKGNFWLYGGLGYVAKGFSGSLNDLWKFTSEDILPVHLISFTGKFQANRTSLFWTVENEQNFHHYEIERSSNGNNFIKIGEVNATNLTHYNYIDNLNDIEGLKVFYRLKMLDKDGKFTYSSILEFKVNTSHDFIVYPNPATTQTTLKLDKHVRGIVNVEIADINGKVLIRKSHNVNGSNIVLPTTELSTGAYLIKVLYNDEKFVQKLVIKK